MATCVFGDERKLIKRDYDDKKSETLQLVQIQKL